MPVLRHSVLATALFCTAYGLILVAGLVGNGFVVAAVAVRRSPSPSRDMRTTTNVFIGNLAFADLLVTILCVPFTLANTLLEEWPFDDTACKLVAYAQAVSISASVNSLVAISVDRWRAIRHPFRPKAARCRWHLWLGLVWLLPLLVMFPWLIVFAVGPTEPRARYMVCTDFWRSKLTADVYFIVVNLVFCYLLPLAVISVCYALIFTTIHRRKVPGELCPTRRRLLHYRSKIKIIKMIFVVIVTFVMCWLPLYIIICLTKFSYFPKTKYQEEILDALLPLAQWLGAANSCINPIIYTCFSQKFRSEFKCLVTCRKGNTIQRYVKYNAKTECILITTSSQN